MTPLTLLFILTFLVTVDVRILAPVLPSISTSLGSSPGTIGLAMTSYSLAYGTGQLFYGPLSDRLGRIAVIRAAGVGFCICTVLSALSVTPWQFILVRLLAGALAGAVIPLTLVFIGDTVEYERRQAVLGRFAVLTSTALAFSASIGGTVSYFISWRFMLLGYGSLALIPLGLMWRLDLRSSGAIEECADSFGDLLRNPYALFVYVGVFLEGFLCWGGLTYLGAFATHRYRLDQFTVGLLIALFGVGMMLGGLLMDRLRRLLSENALAMTGGILMGGSFLVLILHWPASVFAVAMFILGLGYVCLHTTLQLRGTDISATARGRAFSLFAFSLFLGLSTGSATFGWLVDAGRYDVMFIVASLGLIGTGAATAFAPQHGESRRRMKTSDGRCIIHQP
jgi:MFS transporter, YNFM family, putative membrane transport protein